VSAFGFLLPEERLSKEGLDPQQKSISVAVFGHAFS
jgi:hypothetical protein